MTWRPRRAGHARRQNEKGLRRETQALEFFGGRYWDRTSDPCRVKRKLAQAPAYGFPYTREFTAILASHACRCFPWPAGFVAPFLHHFVDSALAFPPRTGQYSRLVRSATPAVGRKARFPHRLLAAALSHRSCDWTAVGAPAPKVDRPSQMKIEHAVGSERLRGGTSDRRDAPIRPRIYSPRPLGPAVRHRHPFRTTATRPYPRRPSHLGPRTPLRRGFEAHLATACSCRALRHSAWAPSAFLLSNLPAVPAFCLRRAEPFLFEICGKLPARLRDALGALAPVPVHPNRSASTGQPW